jgi:hypothetical protein
MKFAYINPTIIGVEDIPEDTFEKIKSIALEAHTYEDLNDEGDPSISIRGGQQIQLLPSKFAIDISILKEYVELVVQDYIDKLASANPNLNFSTVKPEMVSAWTIKQGPGQYQSLHTHEANISGNIYVQCPNLDSDSKQGDACIEFRLPAIKNPAHLIFNDSWTFEPEVSKMIVFPGHLPHTVYPWKGKGSRIVLAWDCILVEKPVV